MDNGQILERPNVWIQLDMTEDILGLTTMISAELQWLVYLHSFTVYYKQTKQLEWHVDLHVWTLAPKMCLIL
jgi:hypothetical protein